MKKTLFQILIIVVSLGVGRRVITGSETDTARKLHQGIRYDHYGTTYKVNNPKYTN